MFYCTFYLSTSIFGRATNLFPPLSVAVEPLLTSFLVSSSMSVCLDLVHWTVTLFSMWFLVLFFRVHVHIFVSCSRLPCRCIDVVHYWADEGFDCLFNWLLEAPYKSFLHVFFSHSRFVCHEEHSNFLNLLIHCLVTVCSMWWCENWVSKIICAQTLM